MKRVRVTIEHAPMGCGLTPNVSGRRFAAGGVIDLDVTRYQYLTEDLAVWVDPMPDDTPDPRVALLNAEAAIADALDEAGDGTYAWDANGPNVKAPWVLEALMNAGWKVVRESDIDAAVIDALDEAAMGEDL